MRIRISHETTFLYSPAARSVIQNLRLTPRSFDTQYVLRWRVGVDVDGALRHGEDSLGNVVHSFSYPRPVERMVVSAVGEIETTDAVGVVRGAVETLQPQMFLRASASAQANAALREYAQDLTSEAPETLAKLHRLMSGLHETLAFEAEAPSARSGAGEAFALKKANAEDFAHVFIACARWLEIPARFVTGYVVSEADAPAAATWHNWVEALSPGLGWVAFDAVHDLCANDRYVRVGVGFDALSAKPIRAAHSGFASETVTTALRIDPAPGQGQGQGQRQCQG